MNQVGTVGKPMQARQQAAEKVVQKVTAHKSMSPAARKMLRELDVVASQFGESETVAAAYSRSPQPESFTVTEPEPPAQKRFPIDLHEQQSVGPAIRKVDRTAETAGLEISGQQEAIRNTQVVVDGGPKGFAGADQLNSEVQVGSGKPKPRQVTASSSARAGNRVMQIEGEEPQEGVPIARFSSPVTHTEIKDSASAKMAANKLDNTVAGKKTKFIVEAAPEDEAEVLGSVGDDGTLVFDDPEPEAEPAGEIPPDFAAKLASAKMFVPKFDWDITRPWQDRVKDAMENHIKKPNWMRAIMAVETADVQRTLRGNLKKHGIEI